MLLSAARERQACCMHASRRVFTTRSTQFRSRPECWRAAWPTKVKPEVDGALLLGSPGLNHCD